MKHLIVSKTKAAHLLAITALTSRFVSATALSIVATKKGNQKGTRKERGEGAVDVIIALVGEQQQQQQGDSEHNSSS